MIEPLDLHSTLSASAITGDSRVYEAYKKLMDEAWAIDKRFDKYFPRGKYGDDIELILLEFYVEGSHHWFTIPEKIKMGRHSLKDKSISVKIPMLKDVSDAVLSNDVQKVNNFLVDTFRKVGELIMTSKPLAKLDFDFDKFDHDYQAFMQHLLDDYPK